MAQLRLRKVTNEIIRVTSGYTASHRATTFNKGSLTNRECMEKQRFEPVQVQRQGAHRLTDEDRAKGWAADRKGGGNPIVSITRRRWCSPNCIVFYQCPLMPIALQAKKGERACLINGRYDPKEKGFVKTGDKLRRRFINMFMSGEDGLIDEMMRTLFDFSIEAATATIQDRKDYMDMLLKTYRSLFGDHHAARIVEPVTITLHEIGFDGEEIIHQKKHVKALIQDTNQTRALKEKFACRQAAAHDPESLADSPILTEILNHEVTIGNIDKGLLSTTIVTEGNMNGVREQTNQDFGGCGESSPEVRTLGESGNPPDGGEAELQPGRGGAEPV